jgi:hypothetical protein
MRRSRQPCVLALIERGRRAAAFGGVRTPFFSDYVPLEGSSRTR